MNVSHAAIVYSMVVDVYLLSEPIFLQLSFAFGTKDWQVLAVAACPITTVNFTVRGANAPVEIFFEP